jgi:hypothetical protein
MRWGQTESSFYAGHCWAYCTSPGWEMKMEQSEECELAEETEILVIRQNLSQGPLFPLQIPRDLTRGLFWAAAVGTRLTALAIARPSMVLPLHHTKLNSVALIRERTMPTERPPLVGEVMPTFADRGCRVVSATDSHGR